MKRLPGLWFLQSILLVLHAIPVLQRHMAAQDRNVKGQGDGHAADPDDNVPGPPGRAAFIHNMCPSAGSSNSLAKGECNGDGCSNLAIGIPIRGLIIQRAFGSESNQSAAAVVIYGSPSGQTTVSHRRPRTLPRDCDGAGRDPFVAGSAQVSAEAQIRDIGLVVETQKWTRQVNIVSVP